MAGVGLRVTIDRREALDRIGTLLSRVDDPRPALEVAGVHMLRSIQRNFDEGGRPRRWQPLKSSTLKAKAPKTRILITNGDLMGSIRKQAARASLTLSSALVYSRIHQLGGQAGHGRRVTIPARPYLVFQDEDLELIGDLIEDYQARAS